MTTIYIFDLDDTVVNSRHRIPLTPEGNLDLPAYRELATPANIDKDTLLPLAKEMQRLIAEGKEVAVLTARTMTDHDYHYLRVNGIMPKTVMSRNYITDEHSNLPDGMYKLRHLKEAGLLGENVVLFDDNRNVKRDFRRAGVPVVCSIKVNKKLGAI